MKLKLTQSDPNGAQRVPAGTNTEPKGRPNRPKWTKMEPKRHHWGPKLSQKGAKREPKGDQNASQNPPTLGRACQTIHWGRFTSPYPLRPGLLAAKLTPNSLIWTPLLKWVLNLAQIQKSCNGGLGELWMNFCLFCWLEPILRK